MQAADCDGLTEFIIDSITAAPAGTTSGVGTEINLVNLLNAEVPDQHVFRPDPVICPCSMMYRVPANVLWSLEHCLQAIRPFLELIGIDPAGVSLADGRGNECTDLFSPRSVAAPLRGMAAGPDFTAYHDALPILGVDGAEWMSLPSTGPSLGTIVAKSGTTIVSDLLNQEYFLLGMASAGYMTTKSGRELIWAVYVNGVLSTDLLDLIGVGADIGTVAEAIYEAS